MKVEIENNSPILKIDIDNDIGCLSLSYNDNLIFEHYPDNCGSIGKIFSLNSDLNINSDIILLKKLLNDGEMNVSDDKILFNQIKPLFNLFETGIYEVYIYDFELNECNLVENDQNYYPMKTDTIILSQNQNSLSEKTIKKYCKQMKFGLKPIVLSISLIVHEGNLITESPIFILDGHHKFSAYKKMKINPRILVFKKKHILY